jgi:hypothetical protein
MDLRVIKVVSTHSRRPSIDRWSINEERSESMFTMLSKVLNKCDLEEKLFKKKT